MSASKWSFKRKSVEVVAVIPPLDILDERSFRRVLQIEEKRTERSNGRFVLMLLECTGLLNGDEQHESLSEIIQTLCRSIRETDIPGWYAQGKTLGTIFTEIGPADGRAVTAALLSRITTVLSGVLSIEQLHQVQVSFHVFPENWGKGGNSGSSRSLLHLDSDDQHSKGKTQHGLKRAVDITGSLCALTVLSPLFLALGVAVKLSSPGPVFFRQERVGRNGRRFTFLKFRSMHCDNRPEIHQEFVKQFIRGTARTGGKNVSGLRPQPIYKIVDDPRITRVGRFIRRTSLDELPQFINVLRGDMSLVGPRPPIPYEVDCYKLWHKRRLIPVKPGITGLWQVNGRSRVGFDDMIRLDLQYARSWSFWLDLKILLRTPGAVIGGAGAY